MSVYRIDPTTDPRWTPFLLRHPHASAFHSAEWLAALRTSYGFEPFAYTTQPAGSDLREAIVFCFVKSWLTGRRFVSIPFADHCDPLCESANGMSALLAAARSDAAKARCRYIEMRPLRVAVESPAAFEGFGPAARFAFHAIDLSSPADALYKQLHKTSIRQMIARAERENLAVSRGRDKKHRDQFYTLLLQTRRKHAVPPQPRSWFETLSASLGDAIVYHVASFQERPVAAIVTIRFGDQLIHKYGCSDAAESGRGGTQLLLWQAIRDGQESGALEFDMGRSDLDNEGLIRFKERWGAQAYPLRYQRSPEPTLMPGGGGASAGAKLAKYLFARVPDPVLELAGRVLYRHVA